MAKPLPRCPPCPTNRTTPAPTPATPHGHVCAACGATTWHFPEEHGPGTDIRLDAAALAAARAGDVAAVERAVCAAHEAGWWVEPRQWALHVEAIHPDLERWRALFDCGPARLRDGVAGLIAERTAGATVAGPPMLRFEVETTGPLPLGARRMAPGLCNPGARSGDALIVSARGPTAADPGPLCRWRRGASPEIVRPAGFHHPLGGEMWSEERDDAVALLRVPASGPAEVLARFAVRHLFGRPLPDGTFEVRASGGASEEPVVEIRDARGRVVRRGPVEVPPERPAPPPFDDGYTQRIVPGGHCFARRGRVAFAPPEVDRPAESSAPWDAAGGYDWVGSARYFLMRTLEATPSLSLVDAVTGRRSAPLETPHPPARFFGLHLPGGDEVVVVADARWTLLSPSTRDPLWHPLPRAAEIVLGEVYGRQVVLADRDAPGTYLLLDADAGVQGEVRGLTPVRSGGFGPVFLADDRWCAVHWTTGRTARTSSDRPGTGTSAASDGPAPVKAGGHVGA
jgi:hypothetical protein